MLVAWTAINDWQRPAPLGPHFPAQLRGRGLIYNPHIVIADNHNAIVPTRGSARYPTLGNISLHEFGLALERIAPAA
ncbi:MAG: hypothetical protein ACRET4_03455, partial [Steroidobacteraceae bacterium]